MVDYMLFTEVMALRQEVERIRDQRDKALQERDQARREACEYATCTHPTVGNSPRALALDKGWDCYKDEDPRWKEEETL